MDDVTRPGPARTLLQVRVGAFVLVGLAVFVGLVYFLGRQAGLFERQYRLVAAFEQIGGLIEGATVRLAGVPVGRVTAIRLPDTGAAKVQVELTLVRRVQTRVRADSVARIETLGLLGDKIVEITLGSRDAPALGDGQELRTEEPLDTARLTRQGTELLRNLVAVTADLRTTLGRLSGASLGADLADTARSLRALVGELERGQGLLHRLVYDRALADRAAEAVEAVRQAGETVRRLDRVLAGAGIGGLTADARQTLAESREAAQRLNRVLREVEEGRGTLHALIYDESRALRELDALLGRAGALVGAVERGEGALGVLVQDPAAARAARRLVAAADGLARLVDQAREGDGLLRALLVAPEGKALVNDLRATARHLREVTERVAGGQGLLGQLTAPGSPEVARQAAEGLAGLGRLADDLRQDARLTGTLTDLRAAMAALRAIAERVEAGEGTLGGLAVDPTVYENLAAFLEGAERSLLLRALIRSAIGRGRSGR